jgi:hypothetical protein
MAYNKTSAFLTPLIGVSGLTTETFENTYIGEGNTLQVVYSTFDEQTHNKLSTAPTFVNMQRDGEKAVYTFTISEGDYKKVVEPFIKGKYTQVDRTYVDKHFPRNPTHPLYSNRLIFDADPAMVEYWALKGVDITLNPSGEVWSIPDLTVEKYEFNGFTAWTQTST